MHWMIIPVIIIILIDVKVHCAAHLNIPKRFLVCFQSAQMPLIFYTAQDWACYMLLGVLAISKDDLNVTVSLLCASMS